MGVAKAWFSEARGPDIRSYFSRQSFERIALAHIHNRSVALLEAYEVVLLHVEERLDVDLLLDEGGKQE